MYLTDEPLCSLLKYQMNNVLMAPEDVCAIKRQNTSVSEDSKLDVCIHSTIPFCEHPADTQQEEGEQCPVVVT